MRKNFRKYYFSLDNIEIDEEEIPDTAADFDLLKEKWLKKYWYESCIQWGIYFKLHSKHKQLNNEKTNTGRNSSSRKSTKKSV